MRSSPLTIGWLLLCAGIATAQAQAPDIAARARAVEAELGKLGLEFSAPTALEPLAPGAYSDACEARLTALLGPGWFEAQHYLRQALGVDAGASPAALRAKLARASFGRNAAFYRPETSSLAFDASRAAADPDLDLLLARELCVAWRSRSVDLDLLLGKEGLTTDGTLVRRALVDGEAQVVALALRELRARRDPTQLDAATLGEPPASPGTDPLTRLVQTAGRNLELARLQVGGWASVRASFSEAPVSTEQLLHVVKLYKDTPKRVVLPTWSAELELEGIVREDTLGELGVQALLLEAGVERDAARLASVGWDGDRLQLLRAGNGDLALVWRILFDRPEDVKQFTAVFGPRALGQVVARGFSIDFVRADSIAFAQALAAALDASKPGATPNKEDQESTAAIEAGLGDALDLRARIEGGLWRHPRYELAIPAPEGWSQELINGQPYLMGPQIEDFRDNLAVVAVESARGATIQELLDKNIAAIKLEPALALEAGETRTLCGREVAFVRYGGQVDKQQLKITSLIFLQAGRPVVITATVAARNWAFLQPRIDALIAGLQLGPTVAR